MSRRIIPVALLLCATIVLTAHTATRTVDPATLTVHEWGTFTSIAGEDGNAVDWQPLAGPTDLPCFVHRIKLGPKYSLSSRCRMETPVLYFYTPNPMTVNVKVRFRQGLVTEWFPQAAVAPDAISFATPQRRDRDAAISWTDVRLHPGAPDVFPTEPAPNHYYAARATGAAPLQVGSEKEKLLFYRGVGDFDPPLAATIAADGRILARNLDGDAVGPVVLFQNRGGSIGYRIGDAVRGQFTMAPPALDAKATPLYAEIERILVSRGLYRDEARAMVETWRDSWFEEGTRLLYIVSRKAIDRILPLDIDPAPTAVARVFVGRLELVTPHMLDEVRAAIARNDQPTVRKYGRFFQPIADRLRRASTGPDGAAIEQQLRAVYAGWRWTPGACDQRR